MESSEHRRAVYRQWIIIQDIIGDAKKWPKLTRRLFWKQNVKHFERLLLAAFVYVNGLNHTIFLEWAYLILHDVHSSLFRGDRIVTLNLCIFFLFGLEREISDFTLGVS